MAISKRTWLGVATEATPLTGIATPTKYVPTKAIMKTLKSRIYLNEERGSRDADNDVVDGLKKGQCEPKGAWYNDVHPYFLMAALGNFTDTQPDAAGAPTAWKHAFSLGDVLKTLTVFKGYDTAGNTVKYMAGCSVEKFSFKWTSDKLLEFETSLVGLRMQNLGTVPTPTYSTVKAFAGWQPTITYNGGATTDIEEFELTFSQKIMLWYPSAGSQDFVTIYPGERSVEVSYTARCDTDALFQRFDQGLDDTFLIDFVGPIIASTTHQELNLSLPTVGYDTMEHDTGKDNVLIKAKGKARPTTGNPLIGGFVVNTINNYNT